MDLQTLVVVVAEMAVIVGTVQRMVGPVRMDFRSEDLDPLVAVGRNGRMIVVAPRCRRFERMDLAAVCSCRLMSVLDRRCCGGKHLLLLYVQKVTGPLVELLHSNDHAVPCYKRQLLVPPVTSRR